MGSIGKGGLGNLKVANENNAVDSGSSALMSDPVHPIWPPSPITMGEFLAKAIDYDEYDHVPRGATLVSSSMPPLFGLGITEAIAVVTITYFICVGSFSVGYFSKVDGKFTDLFSLSDLIGSNLAVFGRVGTRKYGASPCRRIR